MKKGFTLIELLVVIAIISILAAVLFPVFATAREKARQSTCASNEKQIALGLIQYVQDYDELLPCGRAAIYNPPQFSGVGWAAEIYSYVKSRDVFTCPDDTTQRNVSYPTCYPVSYGMNANIGPAKSHASTVSVVWTKLASPSSTVLICEERGDLVDVTINPEPSNTWRASPVTNGVYGADDNPNLPAYGPFDYNDSGTLATGYLGRGGFARYSTGPICNVFPGTADGAHSVAANYAFCDGHVKWLKGDQVSSGQNAVNATDAQQAGTNSLAVKAAGTAGSDNPAFAATFSGI